MQTSHFPVTATMNDRLIRFRRDLEKDGGGLGPNGAYYRLILLKDDKTLAVERVYRGERSVVIGFSNRNFPDPVMARSWAILDGRHEYQPDIPLLSRQMLV